MIKKKIEIDSIVCDCFFTDNSHSMVYIIMPEKVVLKDMEIQADKFNINITVISGMDWNNDMTPWKAPGVRKQDPEFGENADQFLAMLINRIVPETESEIKGVVNNRIIIGTSLSGLFALWVWMKSLMFSSVGSLSGSFWYDGFTEWFCNQPVINRKGKVFLSLGEKEAKPAATRFGEVNKQTLIIEDYLRQNNVNVHFEYNPGSHFAPLSPRIESALSFLV